MQPLDTAPMNSAPVGSAWMTPKFALHRRGALDATPDSHVAKLDGYQRPGAAHFPTPEITLRRSVHDLPRPHFQPPLLLPPLAVSSISPAHSARPLVGLAPLRRYSHIEAAKHLELLQHQQQQQTHHPHQQERQDQHQLPFFHPPRPALSLPPTPRHELSIPSLLSSPRRHRSPRQRSPFAGDHHPLHLHHHPYNHFQRTPLLPALRTVVDDGCCSAALSPAGSSSAALSPASSTSSYSSYGVDGSETAASTSTTPRVATTPRASAARAAAAGARPAAKCRREHCLNAARRKGLCMEHGGRHFCKKEGCSKCAHRGGFCISHGGGRRCAIANCTKSAQSGGICYSHGGGKRCATDGCSHAARSGGFCIKHGKQQNLPAYSDELEQ
ncbi:hypothetical protein PybrP1_011309 [[Pythium] brassicae (nom. inval.)]|nr:hypothetical protein PybrP1_011309 [[Pythium] brassicae (nom. inval.)]